MNLKVATYDPYYLYLHMVETLGHGRVFLLDAAAESTSKYQMSLVAGAPVLEVQVKDGVTSLFAAEGLDRYLVDYLLQQGISSSTEEESHQTTSGIRVTPAKSVIADAPTTFTDVDPLVILEHTRQAMKTLYPDDSLSVPFSAGFLGYLGYDAVHYLERIPKTTVDDRSLPDIRLQVHAVIVQLVQDQVTVFDGLTGLSKVLTEIAKAQTQREVQLVKDVVHLPDGLTEPEILGNLRDDGPKDFVGADEVSASERSQCDEQVTKVTEDVSREKFEESVQKARDYIAAGDIFQVVLSKRVSVPRERHAYLIYDELRKLNPSPYMFIAEYADMRVFGASPEVQFRCVDGVAQMKPIAGTSKGRGKTPEADRQLAEALLQDEKERAEHVMLVDLCRNDLGRVCKIGSVRVRDLMHVEAYSHLFHLVSEVTGHLRDDVSVFHALLATFPAGTLSGAPKIRAMEIIDELESLRRGPYGGMLGMIDFNANANTAIVIRTIVETKAGYYVQVGAGIVADSQPTQEWLECGHKAGAVLQVLGVGK